MALSLESATGYQPKRVSSIRQLPGIGNSWAWTNGLCPSTSYNQCPIIPPMVVRADESSMGALPSRSKLKAVLIAPKAELPIGTETTLLCSRSRIIVTIAFELLLWPPPHPPANTTESRPKKNFATCSRNHRRFKLLTPLGGFKKIPSSVIILASLRISLPFDRRPAKLISWFSGFPSHLLRNSFS